MIAAILLLMVPPLFAAAVYVKIPVVRWVKPYPAPTVIVPILMPADNHAEPQLDCVNQAVPVDLLPRRVSVWPQKEILPDSFVYLTILKMVTLLLNVVELLPYT